MDLGSRQINGEGGSFGWHRKDPWVLMFSGFRDLGV